MSIRREELVKATEAARHFCRRAEFADERSLQVSGESSDRPNGPQHSPSHAPADVGSPSAAGSDVRRSASPSTSAESKQERKTRSVAQLASALRELEGALSAWDQENSHKSAEPTDSKVAHRSDAKRGVASEELRRKTRELLIELKAQIDEL